MILKIKIPKRKRKKNFNELVRNLASIAFFKQFKCAKEAAKPWYQAPKQC